MSYMIIRFETTYLLRERETNEKLPLLGNNMPEKMLKFTKCFKDRKIIVDLLSIFFGIGAWIGVNGIFNQLPLLVQTAPENWNLPSYLTIIVQIANIGPISYSLLKKQFPNSVKDSICIYVILFIGTLSMILMAFLYQKTTYIFNEEHSTSLFGLSFFTALVGCTSSVLFMPFMGNYKEIYLITYLIGEGLSGFLSSAATLIQGIGGNPTCSNGTNPDGSFHLTPVSEPARFSSRTYFIIIFVIMTMSTISFFLLNFLTVCKSQRVKLQHQTLPSQNYKSKKRNEEESEENDYSNNNLHTNQISNSTYSWMFALMSILCFFGNGLFPSIQSFSCLPYGSTAYHLTVALSNMANPASCFLALFLPHTSISCILSLTSMFSLVGIYLFVTALLSPTPPLVGTIGGEVLVVFAWVILIGLLSYIKLSITSVFRTKGGKSLFWCGAFSQMGSAAGALISFFVINFTNVFKSYDPCDNV